MGHKLLRNHIYITYWNKTECEHAIKMKNILIKNGYPEKFIVIVRSHE